MEWRCSSGGEYGDVAAMKVNVQTLRCSESVEGKRCGDGGEMSDAQSNALHGDEEMSDAQSKASHDGDEVEQCAAERCDDGDAVAVTVG